LSHSIVKLRREDGTVYEGVTPKLVKNLIQIDKENALEADTLHEIMWDALQYLTSNETDLDTLSENVKRYVSVWSVRNYVGNGGLESAFYYCPLQLSYAREGYSIISQPIAAKLVRRMEEALKMAISFSESDTKRTDICDVLNSLSRQHKGIISEFLEPKNEVIDWSVFETPLPLAKFVRDNYADVAVAPLYHKANNA